MMMEFSDIISLIALLIAVLSLGMNFWFNWHQLPLLRHSLKKSQVEALEEKKADIGVKLVKLGNSKYRVKIFNRGKAAARNVRIELPDSNNMIPDHEIRDKFPMEVLEQHDSVDLIAAVHIGTPRKHEVLLKWEDDHSDSNEKISYLTL